MPSKRGFPILVGLKVISRKCTRVNILISVGSVRSSSRQQFSDIRRVRIIVFYGPQFGRTFVLNEFMHNPVPQPMPPAPFPGQQNFPQQPNSQDVPQQPDSNDQ